MIRWSRLFSIAIALIILTLVQAKPVQAQPVLLDVTPAPNSTLSASPTAITLTFDRALSSTGSWITVSKDTGERMAVNSEQIDPANRFILSVPVPPLPEGHYQIAYNAVAIGGSTVISGRFEFTVDLPEPELLMVSPVSGQAIIEDQIPIELQVQFFDFTLYNNRVHLYVDGQFITELRQLAYTIDSPAPGVHEIKTVLARFEDEELPETANTVYIAIPQYDQATEGWESAATAEPDSGLQLTTAQMTGIIGLTAILLLGGLWLGWLTEKRRSHKVNQSAIER